MLLKNGTMTEEERVKHRKEMDSLSKSVNKEFDKGDGHGFLINVADNLDKLTTHFIPTGIIQLDEALGGGIAMGACCCVAGVEGCGKTGIAMSAAGQIVKMGGTVLYINTEDLFPKWLYDLYIGSIQTENKGEFYLISPHESGNDVIDALDQYLYDKQKKKLRNLVDLVIIDSITNVIPQSVFDTMMKGGIGKEGQMARQAAMQTKLMARIQGSGLLRNGTAILFISQTRANMDPNSAKYNPDVIPGAKALKYGIKQNVFVKKKLLNKVGKDKKSHTVGHEVLFQITKNNITGYQKRGDYAVIHGVGLDDSLALINKADDWGYLLKHKDWGRSMIKVPLSNGDWVFKNKAELEVIAKVDLEFKTLLRELFDKEKPKEGTVTLNGFEAVREEIEVDDEEIGKE